MINVLDARAQARREVETLKIRKQKKREKLAAQKEKERLELET